MNFTKLIFSIFLSSRVRYFSNSRQSILILAPRLPEFDRASGDLRLLEIIEILRGKYNVFYFNDWMWERFLQRRDYTYLRRLRELGVDVVLSKNALLQLLKKYELKAVVAEFYEIGEKYLEVVKRHRPSVPFILDTVDVHFVRERCMAETVGDRTLAAQAEETRRREVAVYSRSDFVWTVSDLDRTALLGEGIPSEKIKIVPNIHQVAKTCPPLEDRARNTLLFVGGFSHEPNVDAMLFFLQQVLPLIREMEPNVHLNIVGANPPDSIRRLAGQKVSITGFVSDLRPYLDSAAVSIAPLRFGAGMKGKVGEALAAGLPLVTTSIGAQGMPLVSGRDCMIFDQPQEFASAVVQVLSNADLWRTLSENGRKFMQENFAFEAVHNKLLTFFSNLEKSQIG